MDDQDIRSIIDEVLREQAEDHHFRKRAPLSKHTDPDGKTWYSGAISRVQAASAVLALLTTIFTGVWASMGARDQLTVYPHVETMIESRVSRHELDAREEMAAIAPRFATSVDLQSLRQEVAVGAMERQTQLVAIKEQLDRIEQRLNRLGR